VVQDKRRRISWRERVVAALTTLKNRDIETAEACYATLKEVHPLVVALLVNTKVIERVGRVREIEPTRPELYELICQRFALDFDRWLVHRNLYRVNRDRADQVARWATLNNPTIYVEWDGKRLMLVSPSFPPPDKEWPVDDPVDDKTES